MKGVETFALRNSPSIVYTRAVSLQPPLARADSRLKGLLMEESVKALCLLRSCFEVALECVPVVVPRVARMSMRLAPRRLAVDQVAHGHYDQQIEALSCWSSFCAEVEAVQPRPRSTIQHGPCSRSLDQTGSKKRVLGSCREVQPLLHRPYFGQIWVNGNSGA